MVTTFMHSHGDSTAPTATYTYLISGLLVQSQVELVSAIQAEHPSASPDVIIRRGLVPASIDSADRAGDGWAIAPGRFLLHINGVMRTFITGGDTITVDVEPDADPGDVALFLLGTCFAILLHQRGRIVLHASAVAVHGRAMLFCGASGAGKSTMAAMLVRRGYPLINDDVCNLSQTPGGEYSVYPDGRMLKLWSTSLHHLRQEAPSDRMVRRNTEKYYIAPERADLSPRPVGGIYVLEASSGTASLQRLRAADATMELAENAYRPALVHTMGMQPAYFAASVAIQKQAGVYRLTRPMDFARVDEALDMLEASWESGAA